MGTGIWRFTRVVAALALVTVMAVACGSRSAKTPAASDKVRHIGASWADGYSTVAEMTAHADLVVEAVIERVASTGTVKSASVNTTDAVPYTDFVATVIKTLKGRSASAVTIRQTGGRTAEGSLLVVEDDPLLGVGERAMLFLKRSPSGDYFIMGGPAGRFDISASGIVSTLPGGSVHDWSSGSRTLFAHTVQSAAGQR